MDSAVVGLNDVPDNREAKSEAAMATRVGTVHLVKSIEDMRQLVGADALPGVADHELDAVIEPAQADLNAAAGWREFDGVPHEVRDDLMQTLAVAPDNAARLNCRRRQHRRRERILTCHGKNFADNDGEVDRAYVEVHLARNDPGRVEEIVDETRL